MLRSSHSLGSGGRHPFTIVAALALAGVAGAQSFPNGPCWEPDVGNSLLLSDDAVAPGRQLGFAFPKPGGGTTTTIDVCSNGYVWLGDAASAVNARDLSPSISEFIFEPARICAAWMDLTPANGGSFAGGDIYFNTFPGRAVVTWQVREFEEVAPINIQLQLYSDGAFSIVYRDLYPGSGAPMLVGMTPGGGSTIPGETDLSAAAPFAAGLGSTTYEFFDPSTGSDPRDLDGVSMIFLPDSSGGYDLVVPPPCPFARVEKYGRGCPFPMGGSLYEFFEGSGVRDEFDLPNGFSIRYLPAGSGYVATQCTTACWETAVGNPVVWNAGGNGDDSLSTQQLGFTASYAGVTTSSIDICSNGFIWLVSGASQATQDLPSVTQLVQGPARLAVFWTDLNNRVPGGGGTVSFHALPNKAVVTWDQVPQWSSPASLTSSITAQAQLFANGEIIVTYQSMTVEDVGFAGDVALVGFTVGNTQVDPRETDLTTALPLEFSQVASPATPFELDLATGELPELGSTITYEATGLQGSSLAVLHAGFTPMSLPLDNIGMTGCTALATPTASAPLVVTGGVGRLSLPVPNVASLAGLPLFNQALALAPSVNSFGIIASDGLRLTLGL